MDVTGFNTSLVTDTYRHIIDGEELVFTIEILDQAEVVCRAPHLVGVMQTSQTALKTHRQMEDPDIPTIHAFQAHVSAMHYHDEALAVAIQDIKGLWTQSGPVVWADLSHDDKVGLMVLFRKLHPDLYAGIRNTMLRLHQPTDVEVGE